MEKHKIKKNKKYVVIGTGPSAVSVIKVLIRKRIKPIVIDFNYSAEINDKKILNLFLPNFIKKNSSKPFRKTDLISLFKIGGLSNVWGGYINKIHKKEMKNWPVNFNELNRYYNFVDTFFKQHGVDDDYSNYFSLKKLFVQKKYKINQDAQNNISGCPRIALGNYKKIFNSKNYIDMAKKKNQIILIKNFFVKKIVEEQNSIKIFSDNEKIIECNKLYIATGSINTAKILLNSFTKIKKLYIKETSLILSIWLSMKKLKVLEFLGGCYKYITNINKNPFHVQIYYFNKSFINKIQKNNNLFKRIVTLFLNKFNKYFFFTFSYLDQNNSRILILKKEYNQYKIANLNKNLNLYYLNNIKKKLFKNNIEIFRFSGKFGFGNHYGSIFPMKKKKLNYKNSDLYGRILNFKNVHIVDSSILSSIPISTITYTVMANASRIADKTTLEYGKI